MTRVFYLTNLVKDFCDISFPIKYMNDASLLSIALLPADFFKAFDFSEVLFYLFKLLVYCFECLTHHRFFLTQKVLSGQLAFGSLTGFLLGGFILVWPWAADARVSATIIPMIVLFWLDS